MKNCTVHNDCNLTPRVYQIYFQPKTFIKVKYSNIRTKVTEGGASSTFSGLIV